MRLRNTDRGTFGEGVRRFAALVLLIAVVFTPVALALQTLRADDCDCCKETGAKSCGRKAHFSTHGGHTLGSLPPCGSGCAELHGLTPSPAYHFSENTTLCTGFITSARYAARALRTHRTSAFDPSLYLRPPPLN